MQNRVILLLLCLLGACSRGMDGADCSPEFKAYLETVVDRYLYESPYNRDGSPNIGFPCVGSLVLDADGSFQCDVLNGITPSGCATFAGAGFIRGHWKVKGERILLDPYPQYRLALSLEGAELQRDELGVLLIAEGEERILQDEAQRDAWARACGEPIDDVDGVLGGQKER